MSDQYTEPKSNTGGSSFSASPFGMSPGLWWHALKAAGSRMISSEASLRCAGVAFYGFLSLFPAIAAAILIFGLVLDRSILDTILAQAGPLLPSGPEKLLQNQLENLNERSAPGLSLGLIFSLGIALWSGSRGVNALVYALTRAYHERDERSFVMGALVSLGITLGGFAMAVISVVAIAGLPIALKILPLSATIENYSLLIRWPLIAIIVFLGLGVLYRIAPVREPAMINWIAPGAIAATMIWLLASIGFSFYVENFGSYDVTFGSLSAVVVLLLWMYYSAMIFVFGACINAELELQTYKDTTTGAARPRGERGAYVADNIS